ncbi:MAG: DUF1761 domain-containing protein [Promethearchaeota archaeon]|nr:MAG: DUF1761 domain-containing protein [Candidatus Lokiarchaeota archaeon]
MAIEINWLAVIVIGIIYFAIVFFWYWPTFLGNPWLKLVGKEGVEKSKIIKESIVMVFTSIITVLILEILLDLTGWKDIGSALLLSLLAWIGFVAMTAINQNIFNDRGVKLYLIEYGAYLVAFLVSGLLLAIWQ